MKQSQDEIKANRDDWKRQQRGIKREAEEFGNKVGEKLSEKNY